MINKKASFENLKKENTPGFIASTNNLLHTPNDITPHSIQQSARLQTLDLFRGVAALSVMLVHYTYGYRSHYGQSYSPSYDFRYGYLGVQLFFIISGFVIFLTVLQSKSVFDFLYKRVTRLYPTFLVCLVITFVLVAIFGLQGRERGLHTAVFNLSMMPGFFGFPAVDGAYWSLVPEVFFYVFMILIMLSKQLKNILIIGTIFLLLTWINKFVYQFPLQWDMALNVEWNALFFAGILFYKIKFENARKNLRIHALLLFSFITVCLVLASFTERIIVACFFILFYLFSYDKLEWLTWKPLVFLGLISYPMYLVHQNVGYVMMNQIKPFLGDYPVLFIGITILSLIGFSYLIHRFFEIPSLRFFRRIKKVHFDF